MAAAKWWVVAKLNNTHILLDLMSTSNNRQNFYDSYYAKGTF